MTVVNIDDLRKLAKRRLPRAVFDFIDDLYGLGAYGQEGVEKAVDIVRAEIARVLTLLGRPGVAELDASAVSR
jgi:hypothetical protein